jgi:proteasome lid subunit RPN8/RPN11
MDGLELFTATDREECGIILGTIRNGMRLAEKVIKVKNHARKRDDYAIKARDLLGVLNSPDNAPYVFIGFLHTHLPDHDPRPSDRDFKGARIVDGLNCVYQPSTGLLTWYTSESIVEEPQKT